MNAPPAVPTSDNTGRALACSGGATVGTVASLVKAHRDLAGRRLPIARASVAEARRLDRVLPNYRAFADARAVLHDARTERVTPDAAARAVASFLDQLGTEPGDTTGDYIAALAGMLSGNDAADELGLVESVATSPAALALALRMLLRTEQKRPPPAAVLQACREAEHRLDRLDSDLLRLDLLRSDVDEVRDRFDPDAPPLPSSDDGLDDELMPARRAG